MPHWVFSPHGCPQPPSLHSRGQLSAHHLVSLGCSGKQAQLSHCSRFLQNYLGRFLDLRRPYLILSILSWNVAGCRESLPRHPLAFQLQPHPLWKHWANMLKYLMAISFWSASLTSFHICITGIISIHLRGTLWGLNEIIYVKPLEWSKCYPLPPLLGVPVHMIFWSLHSCV